jgi:hypothetical protein
MLGKHGPGPVFLRHREGGTAECMVFGKAAGGRRAFAEDCGGVLGYLDELGRDDGVEPDKVGKHLFCLCIFHTDEVISWCILMVLNLTEREVKQENTSSFKDEAGEGRRPSPERISVLRLLIPPPCLPWELVGVNHAEFEDLLHKSSRPRGLMTSRNLNPLAPEIS